MPTSLLMVIVWVSLRCAGSVEERLVMRMRRRSWFLLPQSLHLMASSNHVVGIIDKRNLKIMSLQ
jgi:hypothetical protein